MGKIIFILDRAHGENVKGKSSPDGTFKEWVYSQKVIDHLKEDLTKLGIPFGETVTGKNEPGLTKRVIRANEIAKEAENAFLISFHNNASSGGRASGIEVFTKRDFNSKDELLANTFCKNLKSDFREVRFRTHSFTQLFKTANFTVIAGNKKVKPIYSGILIEFLFMDNEDYDLKLLKDDNVFKYYVDSILYSIIQICDHYDFGNFII